MAILDKSFFAGDREPPDDIGKFKVSNLKSDVDKILKKAGWKGQAYGCIGLYLSPDNKSVSKGTFFIRGKLEERDVKLACNKIWGKADMGTTITICIPAADSFEFNSGGSGRTGCQEKKPSTTTTRWPTGDCPHPSCQGTCESGTSGSSA
jgi:hypothetical protein